MKSPGLIKIFQHFHKHRNWTQHSSFMKQVSKKLILSQNCLWLSILASFIVLVIQFWSKNVWIPATVKKNRCECANHVNTTTCSYFVQLPLQTDTFTDAYTKYKYCYSFTYLHIHVRVFTRNFHSSELFYGSIKCR